MSKTIVSIELVFGKGDQRIIPDCHRIRQEVFHLEQGLPLEAEYDRYLVKAPLRRFHCLLKLNLSARLTIDKNYRKHRFGRLLVESLHKLILEDVKATSRPAEVECNSHIFTVDFYSDLGYTTEIRGSFM
ncbi:hypothetical protein C8F04DRAFT_1091635 [Mycena alexandri]|uniref:Uncharacterized protein n=1 Tax=Mycena alexandri TaxID=1745969 RepID=A0AAD6T4T3_9AGAR|nr:hypothetical protein C8F04DRAFT_1091635 [Mycena alexandri]